MAIEDTNTQVQWEYCVIQINIDQQQGTAKTITNPQIASDKLKGSLSPDFLKEQFPKQYQDKKQGTTAISQLQTILNSIGNNGWELVESTSLASLFIFIFKKPKKVA